MKAEYIDICFIADDNYVMPTSVAISSLCRNSSDEYKYRIYVLVPEGIRYESRRYLEESAAGYKNIEVQVCERSLSSVKGLHTNQDNTYLVATEIALLKFEIADIFSDKEKILFLDGDIIIRDNLAALYETDLQNNYVAAVRDLPQVIYDEQPIGKEISGRDYFNSGVMLLNLKQIREDNLKEKLIETKKSYKDDTLMDQSVLNRVFKGKVIQLNFLYNVCYINLVESSGRYDINIINEMYGSSYKTVYEIADDIKIMHFSSKLKPWHFYDLPFADEWLKYYFMSSYKNIPIQRIWHDRRDINKTEVEQKVKKLSVKPSGKIIPIVYATDNNYAPFVAVSIESIHENAGSENFYDVNIIVDRSLHTGTRRKLESISYDNLSVTLWDAKNCFCGIDLYSVGHYSKQMYYRWLIPELFSTYRKVIYLDCDIIVNSDLSELYNVSLGENYIGAVNNFLRSNLENHVTNRLNLAPEIYYNSGVLLMNTAKCLNDNIKNKCINLLKKYDKLACPDQDVINMVCKNKILKLDDKWNFQWHHQFKDAAKGVFLIDYADRYENLLNSEPSIIHYTSFVKPWSEPERAYSEYFWKHCRNTVFYEEILFKQIRKKCVSINSENDNKQKKNEYLQKLKYELSEIKNSVTFKIAKSFCRTLGDTDEKYMDSTDYVLGIINGIRQSTSYKFALFITWLPRKMRK